MAALSQPRPRTHVDELIEKARQGDDDAFRSVYEQTSARVYALCLRMMKDETRARDMTQDTYVRAWQHLETYRGDSVLPPGCTPSRPMHAWWLCEVAVDAEKATRRSKRWKRCLARIQEIRWTGLLLKGPSPICPMGHERCCCCTTFTVTDTTRLLR